MGSQEPIPVRDRHLYERYLPEYKEWYDREGYAYVHTAQYTMETEAAVLYRARRWLRRRGVQFTPRLECVRDGEVVMANLAPGRSRRVTIDSFMDGEVVITEDEEDEVNIRQVVSLRPDHCISRRLARCHRRYRARVNLALCQRYIEPLGVAHVNAISQLIWEFWRGGCTDIGDCERPMPLKVITRLAWPSIAARVCKNWNKDGYCRCGLCAPPWLRCGWICPIKIIAQGAVQEVARRFQLAPSCIVCLAASADHK